MKKLNTLKVTVCLLVGSFMFSSCIGSFSLFNQYAKWQREMSDNKFVNAIVGFFLMPIVGSVTMFVDWFVLNTIEFWSGDNPVASNVGKTQNVMGKDGLLYAVKTLKNGYELKSPTGEITLLIHDEAPDSWSMVQNGVTKEIFRFNPDGTIRACLQNGETITVGNDEAGLEQVRKAVSDDHFFALR